MNCSKEEMLLCFKEVEQYVVEYEALVDEHNRLFEIYKGRTPESVLNTSIKEAAEGRVMSRMVVLATVAVTMVVSYLLDLLFGMTALTLVLMIITFFGSFIGFYIYFLKKTGRDKEKEDKYDVIKASQAAQKVREKMQSEHRAMCNICWFLQPEYCYPQQLRTLRSYLEEGKAETLDGMLRLYETEK